MNIPKSKITLAFISFIISASIVGAGSFILSRYSNSIPVIQNLNPIKKEDSIQKPPKETILLLGKGGEKHDGGDLTDTIMIAQILNSEKQINLISVPRDFLVFDESGNYSKINSVYINAINQGKNKSEAIKVLQDKITEITGISFDYYAEVDFKGFVKIVDTVGGVEVNVTNIIDDPYYPGPNYSYQRFVLQAGTQTLDGETALKYSRSRYTSAGGDLDRSRRQQQILSNLKDKVFSLNPILDAPKILSLFNIARENIKTDLSFTDIKKFYDTYQDSKNYTIKSLVIGNNLLTGNIKEGYRQFGSNKGYILEPRIGEKNYLEIQEEIFNIKDISTYEEKLANLNKNKFNLDIVWSENISKNERIHIQEFLTARGFVVKILDSSQFDIISENNTLYLNNNINSNPYDSEKVITEENISQKYIKDIFKPDIISQSNLVKDNPILYISKTLKF